MNLVENIRLAFESLRVNRMRAFLTMLGIIIGISAVITITTIGSSLQATIAATMRQMGGTNMLSAYVEAITPEFSSTEEEENWEYPEMREEDGLTYQMLMEYKKAFEGRVDYVIATEDLGNVTASGDPGSATVQMQGVTPGYLGASKISLISGREISDQDNQKQKPVAVVSDLYAKYAWDGQNPVGKKIQVTSGDGTASELYVVGVYHYDAARMGGLGGQIPESDLETPFLVPYTYAAAASRASGIYSGLSYFQIATSEKEDPTAVKEDTMVYFATNVYNTNENFRLNCYDMDSELGNMESVLNVLTIAISVIAAISLIVGGVGVMNIMLVSVVERTREIGIRKALGAKNRSIRRQFLMEAVVICFTGGIIGIASGIINGFLLARVAATFLVNSQTGLGSFLRITVAPSVPAIVISAVFSVLIGMIFGYYPAKRAAAMQPVEALRYE